MTRVSGSVSAESWVVSVLWCENPSVTTSLEREVGIAKRSEYHSRSPLGKLGRFAEDDQATAPRDCGRVPGVVGQSRWVFVRARPLEIRRHSETSGDGGAQLVRVR